MRTIKFRGKKLHNGNWVCGYLTDVDNTPIGKVGIINSKPFSGCEESSMVIAETIGQFTGLYDKNDKEIYEGDIVKLYFLSDEEDADLYEVRWNDKLGRYELVFICPFNGKENYLLFCDIANITVIGNIYDNKELLTQN